MTSRLNGDRSSFRIISRWILLRVRNILDKFLEKIEIIFYIPYTMSTFSPTVPNSAAGISHVVADVETPGGEKWEHLKSGGKQWQATPKNLSRMQHTRAIPVTWLSSGLCPNRPKGWIPIIIITLCPKIMQHVRQRRKIRYSQTYNKTGEQKLDTCVYMHTLRILNVYCFSTETLVTRRCLNFMLYVHFFSGSDMPKFSGFSWCFQIFWHF